MLKNGIHLTAIAIPAAELFKIPIYANQMTRDATRWTQSGAKSQKIEYISRLFLYITETYCSCYIHDKLP